MSSPYENATTIEGMDAVREYNADQDDANLTEAEKQMRDEELSFYSNSTNAHGDDNIWGLLSGVGGNIYEWYVDRGDVCSLASDGLANEKDDRVV
jgi:alanyl-tRNA synthetase